MTVRIRASVPGREPVTCEAVTLARAVRAAVRRLEIGAGQTLSRDRVGPGEWRWDWSGTVIDVREIRSGTPTRPNAERGANAHRMVTLTLPPEAIEILADLAKIHGSKSRAVAALILAAAK